MDAEDIRVPVYLITGLLESGKTTFMNMTLRQDYFAIDEKTLLINTEEGERTYKPSVLLSFGTVYEEVSEQEEFTEAYLQALEEKHHPARVLLEYNPLWGIQELEEMRMPEGWGIVQEIVTIDASTFQIYQANIKSLFAEMSTNADMVLFNRCDESLPLANFRRSVKVVNPGCQVMFEDLAGNMTDIFEDTVPYDLDAPLIEIDDVDFGIFYVDARDNPERYKGKTIRFKGRVLKSKNLKANYFVPGRQAMTCCADDTTFIGFICMSKFSPKLKTGNWITVTAEVDYRFMEQYGEEGPVLLAKSIKNTQPPEIDMVYFN